jgi:hypothetical protein
MKHMKRVIKRKKATKRKTIRKSKLSKLSRYTAIIPRTTKATKSVGKYTIKKSKVFFKTIKRSIKKFGNMINRNTAKTIHSITKRH